MKCASKNIFSIWGAAFTIFLIYGCDSSALRGRNGTSDNVEDAIEEVTATTLQIQNPTEMVTDKVEGEDNSNVTGLTEEDSESSGNATLGSDEEVEEPAKPSSAPSLAGEDETTQAVQSEDSDSDSSSSDSDSESTSSDEDSSSGSSQDEDSSSSSSSEENLKAAIIPSPHKLKKPFNNTERLQSQRENAIKVQKTKKYSQSTKE